MSSKKTELITKRGTATYTDQFKEAKVEYVFNFFKEGTDPYTLTEKKQPIPEKHEMAEIVTLRLAQSYFSISCVDLKEKTSKQWLFLLRAHALSYRAIVKARK